MAEHVLVKEFLKNHSLVESNIKSFNNFQFVSSCIEVDLAVPILPAKQPQTGDRKT